MKKNLLAKILTVVLATSMLSLSTVGTAFAYNFINESDPKYWNFNPSYRSYNVGAFNQMGYYFADLYSFMNICCTNQAASPGAIMSQSGFTIVQMNAASEMVWGTAVTHSQSLGLGKYLTSSAERSITLYQGAMAWGYGKARSNDGSIHEITSDEIHLTTVLGSDPFGRQGEESNQLAEINPDIDNFVGSDGLVYGVPYKNEAGEVLMPDMGRVTATNGQVGYINIDSMESAIYNGAMTDEGREKAVLDNADAEARIFQQAFADYFGIDALGYDAAYDCITKIRYEDGVSAAIAAMSDDASDELAYAIAEGSIDSGKALSVLEQSAMQDRSARNGAVEFDEVSPSDIAITEDVFNAILDLAMPQLSVSVPVYSEDGVTVIGEYSFGRL